MGLVDNNYMYKINFLPDEIDVVVTKQWCSSVISILSSFGIYSELIDTISGCVEDAEHRHDSPSFVNRNAIMSVRLVKQILEICGEDTFTFIPSLNYKLLSEQFLSIKLGDIKGKIEDYVNKEDYDMALALIDTIDDNDLKCLALMYIKTLYEVQTEEQVKNLCIRRRISLDKITSYMKKLNLIIVEFFIGHF